MKIEQVEESDGVVAGEEFTPEEQMELITARLAHPDLTSTPSRPKRRSKGSGSAAVAISAILVAILGGLATLWRQDKLAIGYCGIGRPTTTLAGGDIPEWANFLRPQCEPCPPHAYCYDKLRTSCEPGFVLQLHPLSLGGLIPLAPSCEPDSEKARKVKAVAERAVEELRDRNAKFECGDLRDREGKRVTEVEMEEPDLKAAIAQKRRKGMSQQEFEELWNLAIGETMNRDEIVSGLDE